MSAHLHCHRLLRLRMLRLHAGACFVHFSLRNCLLSSLGSKFVSTSSTHSTASRLPSTKPFPGSFSSNSNLRCQLAPLLQALPCTAITSSSHTLTSTQRHSADTATLTTNTLHVMCSLPSCTSSLCTSSTNVRFIVLESKSLSNISNIPTYASSHHTCPLSFEGP